MKSISEIKKTAIKKDFIVDNLMKSNGLYCLVARPKVGKSLLTLQFADSIANGTTFLGFNTNPSPVLYISTEMTSAQLLERKIINLMSLTIIVQIMMIMKKNLKIMIPIKMILK